MSTSKTIGRKTVDFRDMYRKDEAHQSPCVKAIKSFRCDKERALKCVNSLVPSYRIMKAYRWKTDLIKDFICGLTIGIMQLPQAMAYAMLADVPPVVGLYMSCFPVFVYCLLGTSKHISMGTVTVVSLLTGSVISKFYANGASSTASVVTENNDTAGNATLQEQVGEAEPGLPDDVKIEIIVSVTFLVGIVQILMGSFRLGLITTYMSDPLVSGFTTAAGIYGGSGQLKHIFGITIPRAYGMFQIVKMYISIIEQITTTNLATFSISCVCILTLYLVKAQINQRFKNKLKLPIPIELIVVVLATIASYFGEFHEKYQVAVVGEVPAGLPVPLVPTFSGVGRYVSDVFTIAVISYAQSVSVAALMAQKHGYTINPNQELIGTGVSNIFGSVFHCYAIAASVCRTYVADATGGRTQMYNIFSASLVLIVIIWIGPLFEPLPKCVLSSVVLVALRCLVLQVLELPRMWRTSKYDFFTWIVTCFCSVILTADYGLFIGLLFSFFTVVLRSQLAKPTKVGKIEQELIYKDTKKYNMINELNGITIIRYQSPLYFANANFFAKEVYRLSEVKPTQSWKQKQQEFATMQIDVNTSNANSTTELICNGSFRDIAIKTIDNGSISPVSRNDSIVTINDKPYPNDLQPGLLRNPISHIILDFSKVSFIDSGGCKVLKQLIIDYEEVGIQVFLADVSDEVWEAFVSTDVIPTYQNHIFLTVDDAVWAAMNNNSDSSKETLKNLNTHI